MDYSDDESRELASDSDSETDTDHEPMTSGKPLPDKCFTQVMRQINLKTLNYNPRYSDHSGESLKQPKETKFDFSGAFNLK